MSAPIRGASAPVSQQSTQETIQKWLAESRERLSVLTVRAFSSQRPLDLEQYSRARDVVEHLKKLQKEEMTKEVEPTEKTPLLGG